MLQVLRLPPWQLRGREELEQLLDSCDTFGQLPLWQGSKEEDSSAAFASVFSLACLRDEPDEQTLYAAVKRWALEALEMPTLLQPLQLGESREFSAAECTRVLAASFMGNVCDPMSDCKRNQGGLNFSRLVRDAAAHGAASICTHKLAALLLYFAARLKLEGTADDERTVRFERIACPPLNDFEAMLTATRTHGAEEWTDMVTLHDAGMEAPADATAFVNFANADFGYGAFIPSCTQEEILQMACPEFNVGMLILGRMGDDEVVNVRGCRRFSSYSGYGPTYECSGSLVSGDAGEPAVLTDILTIDACYSQHFSREKQLRDMRKAYTSFAALSPRSDGGPAIVSTGRWGCGIFGGTPAHKFAHQALAARLARVRLRFSTFGTPDGCDAVLSALQSSRASVPHVWDALLRCPNRGAFEQSFLAMLEQPPHSGAQAREGCTLQ